MNSIRMMVTVASAMVTVSVMAGCGGGGGGSNMGDYIRDRVCGEAWCGPGTGVYGAPTAIQYGDLNRRDPSAAIEVLVTRYGIGKSAAQDLIEVASGQNLVMHFQNWGLSPSEVGGLLTGEASPSSVLAKISFHLDENPASIEALYNDVRSGRLSDLTSGDR